MIFWHEFEIIHYNYCSSHYIIIKFNIEHTYRFCPRILGIQFYCKFPHFFMFTKNNMYIILFFTQCVVSITLQGIFWKAFLKQIYFAAHNVWKRFRLVFFFILISFSSQNVVFSCAINIEVNIVSFVTEFLNAIAY